MASGSPPLGRIIARGKKSEWGRRVSAKDVAQLGLPPRKNANGQKEKERKANPILIKFEGKGEVFICPCTLFTFRNLSSKYLILPACLPLYNL